MKRFRVAVTALLLMGLSLPTLHAQTANDKPSVIKLDPALDELIASDAKLELAKGGFGFTEGTTWVPQGKNDGYLVFSDMAANVIYKLTMDGQASVYLERSGYTGYDVWNHGMDQTNGKAPDDPLFRKYNIYGSNGTALDRQGRLVIATWGGRSVDRLEKNGKRVTLADTYDGKRFNGTNDLVVKKDGAIYFTDGFGGLRLRDKDPDRGLDYQGIYMWKDGTVTLVIKDIPTPNGLSFSPDEKYLYANGSAAKYVRRYDVQADDAVTNSQMFSDMSSEKTPGITDGMKVDAKGNVYESCCGGVWIISPEGKHLGTIPVPELVANLEFGDPDLKTLYIAARTSIYKIRVKTPGIPGR